MRGAAKGSRERASPTARAHSLPASRSVSRAITARRRWQPPFEQRKLRSRAASLVSCSFAHFVDSPFRFVHLCISLSAALLLIRVSFYSPPCTLSTFRASNISVCTCCCLILCLGALWLLCKATVELCNSAAVSLQACRRGVNAAFPRSSSNTLIAYTVGICERAEFYPVLRI